MTSTYRVGYRMEIEVEVVAHDEEHADERAVEMLLDDPNLLTDNLDLRYVEQL